LAKLLAFMRHGKAEPKKPGMADGERRLTPEGREDVKLVAKALPFKPSVIYHSPLRRAAETAEILSKELGVGAREAYALEPEQASLSSLRELNPPDRAVLVGHAPSLPDIVSTLIGGGRVKLRAGGLAVLLMLVSPADVRRVLGLG